MPQSLPQNSSLEQLRKQSKDLLKAVRKQDPDSIERVLRTHPAMAGIVIANFDQSQFTLRDAQLVIAREFGFENWKELKQKVQDAGGEFVKEKHYVKLREAVEQNDLDEVCKLLEREPWLTRIFVNPMPIHAAVANRQPEIIKKLLDNGADIAVTIAPFKETTPLQMAKDRGYDEIIEIIQNHPEVKRQIKEKAAFDTWLLADGTSEPMPIEMALRNRDYNSFVEIVNEASLENRQKFLQSVVTEIAENPDAQQLKMFRFLLEAGVNANDPKSVEQDGQVLTSENGPLYWAVCRNSTEVARLLMVFGADPNRKHGFQDRDDIVTTAMHHSAAEIVELLLAFGAKVPIKCRARFGPTDIFRKEFNEASCAVDDEMLVQATLGGNNDILDFCLQQFDSSINCQILHRTVTWNVGEVRHDSHFQCFERLLQHGVEGLNDSNIFLPIHALAKMEDQSSAIRYAEILLKYGQELNVLDEHFKSTPLGWAARLGRIKLAEFFLKRDVDLTLAGEPWATPLAWAEKKKFAEMARLIESFI